MNQTSKKKQTAPLKWDLLILSALLASGFVRLFRTEFTALLERMAGLIGKSFASRSASTQTLAFFLVGAILCGLLYLILKRTGGAQNRRALIIGCLAVLVLLTAVLCFEQTIRRDDYWEIHDAQKYGFPGFLVYEFTASNGRYFSYFLRSFYNFFDPQTFIRVRLFVNLLLLGIACTLLTDRLLGLCGVGTDRMTKFVLGTMTAVGLFFISPNIWEVWLWGSGTFVYGVSLMLAIFTLVLYLDAIRGKPKYVLTLLVITCACGASELGTASVCAFGLGILILNRIFGERKWNKALLLFMLWSWGCTIAELLLSGSASYAVSLQSDSAAAAAVNQSPIVRLIESLPAAAVSLWGYLLSKKNYFLLFGLMSLTFGTRFKGLKASVKVWAWSSALLILTAIGALGINAAIGHAPARVAAIPLSWVFLVVMGSCFILGSKLKIESGAVVPAVCAVILCLHLGGFFRENIVMLDNNRLGWEYRDAQLKAETAAGTVTACTLHVPGSVRPDLDEDPTYEFNIVTAYYYGLEAVTAGDYCPPITE